ncbi:SET domain-containing protein [Cavenderia fasciculata]|uniref:SET domain-containing protein n=1 Tax=Cavenderia fasciculata TaxID=261658 RepID=F4PLP7_CACFS|nr:SET domain-containing protein [Cavenderia fasciculata]EGG23469.1 SET domain-containing protein [Cavenderia fasciculata]|eukprot:XP_004361320.1 SET domain-containing protein [Cavenderia fasciculata]
MEIPSLNLKGSPIEIKYTENEGRYVVASRDLEAGETILLARSYVSIASDNVKKNVCNHCLQYSPSTLVERCSGCRQVYWCDTYCYLSNRDIHKHYECKYFKNFNKDYLNQQSTATTSATSQSSSSTSSSTSSSQPPLAYKFDDDDWTEIRMLVAILSRFIAIKYLGVGELKAEMPTIQGMTLNFADSTLQDVLSLVENKITESNNKAACKLINLIERYVTLLIKDVHQPQDHTNKKKRQQQQEESQVQLQQPKLNEQQLDEIISMIRPITCKIRCNQFGIWSKKDKCLGVSVTPIASYFNHSCCPNIVDVRGTTLLEFKALHFIPKGSQLCISYLDLDQTTDSRQDYLIYSYYFKCGCKRCNDKGDSIDNWISQFYCQGTKKCSGTYFLEDEERQLHKDILTKSNDNTSATTTATTNQTNKVNLTCSYCWKKRPFKLETLLNPPSNLI